MSNTQSNTRSGILPITGSEDLTGKEGCLVDLVSGGLALPGNIDDRVHFVVDDGKASGEESDVIPFEPSRNIRVKASGTGACGDLLCLAVIDGTTDGYLRKVPAAPADTYYAIAKAEEAFADGQLVKVRPICREAIVVT